jgi:sugar phosphate isomerase/epimerase
MRIGYHNHAIEFQAKKGQRPWDTFLRNSSEEVLIELDLGNAGYGAADPIALLKQLKGRARFIHVKDYTAKKPDLIVGDGEMDWRGFFPAAEHAEWFVIEHDSDEGLNLADISECLNRFREKQRLYNR